MDTAILSSFDKYTTFSFGNTGIVNISSVPKYPKFI